MTFMIWYHFHDESVREDRILDIPSRWYTHLKNKVCD